MPIPDGNRIFIGDGGLETVMIFREGLDLPEFASFTLLREERGRAALRRYYEDFIELATAHGAGFTLDTPTWRASENWGRKLGLAAAGVGEVNREAVAFAAEVRANAAGETPIAVCGTLGPEGDAYRPERFLSAEEAEAYHAAQVAVFAAEGVDMVSAYTLSYTEEAIGMVRAATVAGLPVSLSFTVETDGRLPTGEPLQEAVERLDAATDSAAAYLMINCAHPTHFAAVLQAGGAWTRRIGGIRANASRMTHAELDESEQLDDGDPELLGREYEALEPLLPDLRVLGGCCGTDQRHLASICERCLPV